MLPKLEPALLTPESANTAGVLFGVLPSLCTEGEYPPYGPMLPPAASIALCPLALEEEDEEDVDPPVAVPADGARVRT